MAEHRFSGPPPTDPDGTPWTNQPTRGEVGGSRIYDGKAPSIGIWKCPSCRTDNDGPLEQGCASCGAGAPGKHVGIDPPPRPLDLRGVLDDGLPLTSGPRDGYRGQPREATIDQIRELMTGGLEVHEAARAWVEGHPHDQLITAFLAGYQFAMQRTMRTQAPVTSDVLPMDPTSKGRRTIIAALKIFRDQVLAQSPDEVSDGEWCSVAECDELIAELEKTL